MSVLCDVDGCEKDLRVLKWCRAHYLQQYHGRPFTFPKKRYRMTDRDELGRKRCGDCATWKPESDFASSRGRADGLQSRCRQCNAAIYRGRADIVRDKMREQRFGLTREAFDALFAAQGNCCAICGGTNPGPNFWAVDHDHACCPSSDKTCGQCVRGILCMACNHGIGSLRDDSKRLRAAADYLDRHARAGVTRGAT